MLLSAVSPICCSVFCPFFTDTVTMIVAKYLSPLNYGDSSILWETKEGFELPGFYCNIVIARGMMLFQNANRETPDNATVKAIAPAWRRRMTSVT